MVDAIGPKTVSTPDRLVVSTTPVTTVASVAKQPAEVARQPLELSAIASEVGKGVPVDSQPYPITPDTIADRMLALNLNWSPKK